MLGFCCCGGGGTVYPFCPRCHLNESPNQFLVEISGFDFLDFGNTHGTCPGSSNCDKINGSFVADRISECTYEYVFPVTAPNNVCHPRRIFVNILDGAYMVRIIWSWTTSGGAPVSFEYVWNNTHPTEMVGGFLTMPCLTLENFSVFIGSSVGDMAFPCFPNSLGTVVLSAL